MRIQVDATVVPVPVIEVPVNHQDRRFLQVLQGFLPDVRLSIHSGNLADVGFGTQDVGLGLMGAHGQAHLRKGHGSTTKSSMASFT